MLLPGRPPLAEFPKDDMGPKVVVEEDVVPAQGAERAPMCPDRTL